MLPLRRLFLGAGSDTERPVKVTGVGRGVVQRLTQPLAMLAMVGPWLHGWPEAGRYNGAWMDVADTGENPPVSGRRS